MSCLGRSSDELNPRAVCQGEEKVEQRLEEAVRIHKQGKEGTLNKDKGHELSDV